MNHHPTIAALLPQISQLGFTLHFASPPDAPDGSFACFTQTFQLPIDAAVNPITLSLTIEYGGDRQMAPTGQLSITLPESAVLNYGPFVMPFLRLPAIITTFKRSALVAYAEVTGRGGTVETIAHVEAIIKAMDAAQHGTARDRAQNLLQSLKRRTFQ